MSMELMVKAMKAQVGNPLRKLVLIKLADNASDTGECWPSYQHIADQCEISRRSAMRHIADLEEAGFLTKIERKGGIKGNKSHLYKLHISAGVTESHQQSEVVTESHQGGDRESPVGGDRESPRTSHSSEPVIEPVISIDASAVADASHGSRAERKRVQQKTTTKPDVLFEQVWSRYPKRAGSNPKNKAQSAWNARKKLGVSPAVMAHGLDRYIAFCEATGRVGTEFVMQAARFFGPSHEFENDWTPPTDQPKQQGANRSKGPDWDDTSWANDLGGL